VRGKRPRILLRETEASKGGAPLALLKQACPLKMDSDAPGFSPVALHKIFHSRQPVIEWFRAIDFQLESLKQVTAQLLRHLPRYAAPSLEISLSIPDELQERWFVMNEVTLFVSSSNPGATEVAYELQLACGANRARRGDGEGSDNSFPHRATIRSRATRRASSIRATAFSPSSIRTTAVADAWSESAPSNSARRGTSPASTEPAPSTSVRRGTSPSSSLPTSATQSTKIRVATTRFDVIEKVPQCLVREAKRPADNTSSRLSGHLTASAFVLSPLKHYNSFRIQSPISPGRAGRKQSPELAKDAQSPELEKDADDTPTPTHFLLLVSPRTWLGVDGMRLADQVRAALDCKLPIVLLHKRDDPHLDDAFDKVIASTPGDLLRRNLYGQLATPLLGGTHRKISLILAAKQLGARVVQHMQFGRGGNGHARASTHEHQVHVRSEKT